MLYGIEAAASEAGFSVSVAAVPVAGPRQLGSALRRLQEQGVEGVVVIVPVRSAGDSLAVHRDRTPVVALAGTASDLPLVGVDQAAGARLAIEHLLALGHPTVWHVAGPDDWLAAGQRADGWRRTLSAAGIEAPDPLAATGRRGRGTRPARCSPPETTSRRCSSPTT
jgi:DNA-binding LacI/PurR family transcriptional regulator